MGTTFARLLLVGLCLTGTALAQAPTVPSGRLGPGEQIQVDGMLGDPAWRRVEWFGDFVQSVPDFGRPATEPTRVAFLLDDRYVYVGVRCDDSKPGLIRARKLRHRDRPETDDHLQIVFDTYRDQVRGTVFIVNPLGAKEEGLVNGYRRYTWDWNEVWQVETAITDNGWQAELRIPLRLLRYRKDQAQEWGVNVKRVVRRLQEESYLSAVPPPYDISSLNFAGVLSGVELGKRQRNLQFIPYALGGVLRETDAETGEKRSESIEELGFDIKYSVTSDLTLDFTANTDFAQVESDDQQVNLTRFSLFFPEKREFFLENAELFQFGQRSGPPGRAPDVTPFFSRRIGLYEDSTVPITAGARLSGKIGQQDIGLLSIATEDVGGLQLDSAWYNVARVRRDLGGRSYVGGILTDSRRGEFHSTTAGFDGAWFLTQDLVLFGDVLVVDDGDSADSTSASYIALDLTTDRWGFIFDFREVEEGFAPDLGFVRRDGYRRKNASIRHSFRPGKWGVRRVTIRPNGSQYDSLVHGVRESSDINLHLEAELENGDELTIRASREFERLFEEFELGEELAFAAGDYTFDFISLDYESDRSRRWGIEASAVDGEFYDGEQSRLAGELWIVFNRHVRVSGSYSSFDITAGQGAIDWRLWSLRLDYTHSATLSASGFVQHNSSTDNTDLNLRLRKILRHDSDLFVVFNERTIDDDILGELRERDFAVKISYRFFL